MPYQLNVFLPNVNSRITVSWEHLTWVNFGRFQSLPVSWFTSEVRESSAGCKPVCLAWLAAGPVPPGQTLHMRDVSEGAPAGGTAGQGLAWKIKPWGAAAGLPVVRSRLAALLQMAAGEGRAA